MKLSLNYNSLVHHPPIFEPIHLQAESEPSRMRKTRKKQILGKYRELLKENIIRKMILTQHPREVGLTVCRWIWNRLKRRPELNNILCQNRRKILLISKTLFSYATQRIKMCTFLILATRTAKHDDLVGCHAEYKTARDVLQSGPLLRATHNSMIGA